MLSFKYMKKFIFSLLVATFIFASVAPKTASAQWYNQNPVQWYKHVYDDSNPSEIFGERYTAAQVDWIIMSFLTWPTTKFVGTEGTICFLEAVTEGTAEIDECVAMSDNLIEVIERLNNLASTVGDEVSDTRSQNNVEYLAQKIFLEDRELSGISYVRNSAKNFSLVPTAQAQEGGYGYSRLGGVTLKIWKASRDAAYAMFVVIAIILAFMIMFRVKTSPQTVVTIQSALPKLFIALVATTFSYAIAGFLVDIMYVFIAIISMVLGPITANGVPDFFMGGGNDVALTFSFLTEGILGTGIIGFLVFDLFLYPITFALSLMALPEGIIGNIFGLPFFVPLAALAMILGFIIFIFAFVWVLFKTTLMLLKTTATILILVMFAPFQITLGAIVPGMGLGSWIKTLSANLAVFPVAGAMLTLSYIFLSEAFDAAIQGLPVFGGLAGILGIDSAGANFGDGWPPLLGGAGDPAPLILLIISVMLLFLVPKAAEIVKGIISGRPLAYGSAAGEAMGLGSAVGFGSASYLSSQQQSRYTEAVKTLVPGASLSPKIKGEQATWGFLRGVSGGKLR